MSEFRNPGALVESTTLLIVDDEWLIRAGMVSNIQDEFPDRFPRLEDILEAHDGNSAKDVLAKQHVDVVVTDWEYPDGGGKELIQHLRENYPGIQCLVVTGSRSPDVAQFCKDMNIQRINKSPNHKELLTALATIFKTLQTAFKPERTTPHGPKSGMHHA